VNFLAPLAIREETQTEQPIKENKAQSWAETSQARVTTYAADPRLAFAEVVTEPSGKAEVRATAFLLDRPPGPRGQA
jgi:hypothetical protein